MERFERLSLLQRRPARGWADRPVRGAVLCLRREERNRGGCQRSWQREVGRAPERTGTGTPREILLGVLVRRAFDIYTGARWREETMPRGQLQRGPLSVLGNRLRLAASQR